METKQECISLGLFAPRKASFSLGNSATGRLKQNVKVLSLCEHHALVGGVGVSEVRLSLLLHLSESLTGDGAGGGGEGEGHVSSPMERAFINSFHKPTPHHLYKRGGQTGRRGSSIQLARHFAGPIKIY